jgi:hypothetical protein
LTIVSVADPGTGIRWLFDPRILDPEWVKESGSGSGMNNPYHISESLETNFWVIILKFFDADPGWKKIQIRDKHPGSATLTIAEATCTKLSPLNT